MEEDRKGEQEEGEEKMKVHNFGGELYIQSGGTLRRVSLEEAMKEVLGELHRRHGEGD